MHVLRNPYDQITTALIYALIDGGQLTKMDFTNAKKNLISGSQMPNTKGFVNETLLRRKINNLDSGQHQSLQNWLERRMY